MSVLEIASSVGTDPTRSMQLVAGALPLVAQHDHRERFFLQRRLLRLHADNLEQVVEAGSAAGAWQEIAALYECLARIAQDPSVRHAFGAALAQLCEMHLANPARAYVALQSMGLKPVSDEDCVGLERLAEVTGRWEDVLAVLDVMVQDCGDQERVLQMLLRRAEICEMRASDPRRAFMELQRFVEARSPGDLSPTEQEILMRMRRLAVDHGLMPELLSVYDSLWIWREARSSAFSTRAGARPSCAITSQIRQQHFSKRFWCFGCNRQHAAAQQVIDAANALNQWDARYQCSKECGGQLPRGSRLALLARLYEERCENPRAMELLAEALRWIQQH